MNELLQFLDSHPSYGYAACVIAGGVLSWFGIQRMVVAPLWKTIQSLSHRLDEIGVSYKEMNSSILELAEAVSGLSGMDRALSFVLSKEEK